MKRLILSLFAGALAFGLLQINTARASTWTNLVSGSASGNWSTAANWSPNSVPDGVDAVADFSTLDITAESIVTVATTSRTVGTLDFGNTDPAPYWDWQITSPDGSGLNLATSTGSPLINV